MGDEGVSVLAALQAVEVATRANERRELSSGAAVLRSARMALTMARLGRYDGYSIATTTSTTKIGSSSVAVARTRAIKLHQIATDNSPDEKLRLLRQVREALKNRAAPAQVTRVMASLARDMGVPDNNIYINAPNHMHSVVPVVKVHEMCGRLALPSSAIEQHTCLICLDSYENAHSLALCDPTEGGCGNYFHSQCLNRWLNYKDGLQRRRCPLCRRGMR